MGDTISFRPKPEETALLNKVMEEQNLGVSDALHVLLAKRAGETKSDPRWDETEAAPQQYDNVVLTREVFEQLKHCEDLYNKTGFPSFALVMHFARHCSLHHEVCPQCYHLSQKTFENFPYLRPNRQPAPY